MNDIELDETKAGFENKKGWKPIGDDNYENNFEGIFNGNNHKITGLWINRPDTDYVGFFGYTSCRAQIKNLGVEVSSKGIVGNNYVGGIVGDMAGKNYKGNITNSYSKGNVSGNSRVGGIVGSIYGGDITNSYSIGDINGEGNVGGIAGCVNGYNRDYETTSSSMRNSYFIGNVIGNHNVGGIAGCVGYSSITDSYFIGNVSGNDSVGGIAGYVHEMILNEFHLYDNSITSNVAINLSIKGFIWGFSDINTHAIGGIESNKFYKYKAEVISNNFTRKALTSRFIEDNESSGIGKDDSEFVSKETYEVGLGWRFGNDDTNPWKIDENKNYGLPYLYWQDVPMTKRKIFDKANISIPNGNVHTYTISFIDGNLNVTGSVAVSKGIVNIIDIACEFGVVYHLYIANSGDNIINNPIYKKYDVSKNINFYAFPNIKEIRTQEDLDDIRNDLNGRYILMNDIELKETKAGFDADGWIPINGFTGTFNGNSHKITALWINRPDTNDVGLFGYIKNSQIKNLGVEIAEGKEVKGKNSVGGIAGWVWSGNITNSYSKGDISGNDSVGGIAGSDGNIINSYSAGDINGNNYVGGIIGNNGNVYNSHSTGDISGNNYVGGIVGGYLDDYGKITNSYSKGNISGKKYVGGIVGYIENRSITNNAAINLSINSSSDFKNRIVGYVQYGYEGRNSINTSDNFALKDMEGDFIHKGVCHGISKTETEFKTKSTYEAGLKWKFGNDKDNPWKIDPNKNNGYPYLYWQKFASSQKVITSKSSLNIEPQFVCHPAPVKTSGKSNLNIKPQWRKSIEEEIERRKIEDLVHFTRIENLPNILRLGLVPRAELSSGFYPTDDERRDDNLDGNCLSITRPNGKMLQSKINHGYKLALLVFDIKEALFGDYLSSLPKFFYTNSASNEIRYGRRIIETDELGGSYSNIEAFRFMFKDEFNVTVSYEVKTKRRYSGMPLKYTTDIQAEVVICDIIPPHYIKEIIFYNCDENDINSFCEELARNGIWRVEQEVYFGKSIIDINAKLEQIKQENKYHKE
jgi:hypothetical protein